MCTEVFFPQWMGLENAHIEIEKNEAERICARSAYIIEVFEVTLAQTQIGRYECAKVLPVNSVCRAFFWPTRSNGGGKTVDLAPACEAKDGADPKGSRCR